MKTYKQFIEEATNSQFLKGLSKGMKKAASNVANLPSNTLSTVGKKIKDSGIKASTTRNDSNRSMRGSKRFVIGSTIERMGL
jgi:hypothetical protein